MQKLEFIGWRIRCCDKDKFICLVCQLTDVTFDNVCSNCQTLLPIYGDKCEIELPFELKHDGSVSNCRISLPMPICCYGSSYYDTAVTRRIISNRGVYVEVRQPTLIELDTITAADNNGNNVLIVTVYNSTMTEHMNFVVYCGSEHEHIERKVGENKMTEVTKLDIREPVVADPTPTISVATPVITFGKMYDDVIVPTKRREDAGLDIYAYFTEEFKVIPPHGTAIFNTGLVSHFSEEWYIQLNERGSTGTIGIGQRSGIIDSGYRGEWMVPLTNTSDKWFIIAKGVNNLDDDGKKYAKAYYGDIFNVKPENIILYPYTKAICQAIVHQNFDVTVKVDTVDNVKTVPSARGSGKLGSSGK